MSYSFRTLALYFLPRTLRERYMRSILLSRKTSCLQYGLDVMQKRVPYLAQVVAQNVLQDYWKLPEEQRKLLPWNGTSMKRLVYAFAYGWTPIRPG